MRLTRDLHRLLPAEGEVAGLLALMLLTEARREARVGVGGALVPLDEQDRSRWDRALIDEGTDLVAATLPSGPIGPYQVQAAIAAVHSEAASIERDRLGADPWALRRARPDRPEPDGDAQPRRRRGDGRGTGGRVGGDRRAGGGGDARRPPSPRRACAPTSSSWRATTAAARDGVPPRRPADDEPPRAALPRRPRPPPRRALSTFHARPPVPGARPRARHARGVVPRRVAPCSGDARRRRRPQRGRSKVGCPWRSLSASPSPTRRRRAGRRGGPATGRRSLAALAVGLVRWVTSQPAPRHPHGSRRAGSAGDRPVRRPRPALEHAQSQHVASRLRRAAGAGDVVHRRSRPASIAAGLVLNAGLGALSCVLLALLAARVTGRSRPTCAALAVGGLRWRRPCCSRRTGCGRRRSCRSRSCCSCSPPCGSSTSAACGGGHDGRRGGRRLRDPQPAAAPGR